MNKRQLFFKLMQNVCLSIQMNIIKDLKGFFVKGCKDSQDQTKKTK